MFSRLFFQTILSISSTIWIIVIYCVKTHYSFRGVDFWLTSILLIVLVFVISAIGCSATRILEKDNLTKCTKFSLADNDYLPVYLGYSFVALSIDDIFTLLIIFLLITVLIMRLDAYFNPAFLVLGYHYYQVITEEGTEVFIICKDKERNPKRVYFKELRRINNRTYISHGGER